jgi:hypothetical protein
MQLLDANCPEVNGFFARIEEMGDEGRTEDEMKTEIEAWVKEHHEECPMCRKIGEESE